MGSSKEMVTTTAGGNCSGLLGPTERDRANLVVLQHLDVVDDYVARHKKRIAKKYRDKGMLKTDDEVTVEHNATFLRWFKQQVLENPRKRAVRTDCSYTP